jgi:hypothetical protein
VFKAISEEKTTAFAAEMLYAPTLSAAQKAAIHGLIEQME